jgi:CBS domain-containing protein
MNAKEIMTVQTQSCGRHESLDQVARKMWEHDCGAIPIMDEQQRPVGILTDRDIAMATMLNHRPQWELTAGEIIADRQLHTCQEGDSVNDCLALMEEHSIRRVPVVDTEGNLAGIISIGDAIAFTGNSAAHRKHALSPKQTLTMLKAIAAHHESGARVAAS